MCTAGLKVEFLEMFIIIFIFIILCECAFLASRMRKATERVCRKFEEPRGMVLGCCSIYVEVGTKGERELGPRSIQHAH